MKTFKNKTTDIRKIGKQPITNAQAQELIGLALAGKPMPEDSMMTYADLALVCLDQPPQGGFTASEMRERINIQERIESSNSIIELEDAEWKKLRDLVDGYRWGIMHPDILAFVDAVREARTPEEKEMRNEK